MSIGRTFFVCAGLLSLALLLPRPAAAVWPTDPNVNVPLCIAAGGQYYPIITSDGAGGAIVTWTDPRSGTGNDIYAQRISADGTVQWTANGVALCTATGDQAYPAIVSDGVGGAIVTWHDSRGGGGTTDIYAQRISADGTVQWRADGVPLSTATDIQQYAQITSDGAGGAIVTWKDFRSGVAYDIYAQRISAEGTVQWTANGVALSTATGTQYQPAITSDGAGGAIVTWMDSRSGTGYDIYAQRILAEGTVQWTADGVAICTDASNQYAQTITSDGAGGAIITWYDYRSETGDDIYAQRISATGTVQWTVNGVALCAATGAQQYPTIVSDGVGGAIVTWMDFRSGTSYDIYAQRISATGTVQWTANGVALCTATGTQQYPTITSDGAGGAIVTWADYRSGASFDIYAQRIPATGTVQWTANGVALCTATSIQQYPTIVSDGVGGAIVTWMDARSSITSYDIYAQRVQANGQLGGDAWADVPPGAPLAFALDPVRPNPARGGVLTVHFSLPTAAPARLELLDVAGRRIASHEVGAGQHTLDLGQGQHLAPGLYLVRLTQGANTRVTRVAVLR